MAEEDEEESAAQAHHQQVVACVALIGHVILESRRVTRERRQVTQHYLCRPDLIPNPRAKALLGSTFMRAAVMMPSSLFFP